MKISQSFTGSFILSILLFSLLLAGCAAPTLPPAPTQDPQEIVAAAVATMRAEMTAEAIRNPSSTPTAMPTAITMPTATPVPPTSTPSVPTETPTSTATPAPQISAKFLSAGTYPENKREYIPNQKFGLAVRFQNTGSIAWAPGYQLKLTGFQGEVTVEERKELGQGIDPGKAAEFDLQAFGSEMMGVHVWYFQLYTSDGYPVPGGSASFTYTAVMGEE